jgi:hypothetical protein
MQAHVIVLRSMTLGGGRMASALIGHTLLFASLTFGQSLGPALQSDPRSPPMPNRANEPAAAGESANAGHKAPPIAVAPTLLQLQQMRKEGKQLSAADQARLDNWEAARNARDAKQAALQREISGRAMLGAAIRQYEAAGLSPEQAYVLAAADVRKALAQPIQGAAAKPFDVCGTFDKQTQGACGLLILSDAQIGQLSAEVFKLMVDSFELGQRNPVPHESPPETGVAVIAPSISTEQFAKATLARLGLIEVKPKKASRVLVVVRSLLIDPLQANYNSIGELAKDADSQLNIIGPKYHSYFFRLDDDLSVTQLEHVAEDASN